MYGANYGKIHRHMVQSKYDRYSGSSSSSDSSTDYDNENIQFKFTPYASFEAEVTRVFGTETPYGDSLGVVFDDVEITDGVLYLDSDKEVLKLFSWEQSTGFSIMEALERGEAPDIDDAPDPLAQTYGDTKKRYRLVGAVIEEVVDDGETLIDAQSKVRDYSFEDGEPVMGDEFEDLGGDPITIDRELISWQGASDDGPTSAATRFTALLTEKGPDMIGDDETIEWLNDTSGTDVLRDDLDGRRVEVFLTEETSDESGRTWYRPTVIDTKTEQAIGYNNADDGDSGN